MISKSRIVTVLLLALVASVCRAGPQENELLECASPLFENLSGKLGIDRFVAKRVSFTDFNGDGLPDLAVVNRGENIPPINGTVSVLLGNGSGSFSSSTRFEAGRTPLSITTMDFNGDHVLDMVTADSRNDNVSVFLGLQIIQDVGQ